MGRERSAVLPYDQDLGPVLFDHYGADTARRVAERSVRDVLEIAVGTGIVTRHLRNVLARNARLTAIDISDSMMDIARKKFLPHEQVTFQNANATALPFDPVACHQIDPIKEKLIRAGFDRIVISVQRHEYDIPDVSAFARALVFTPVIFEKRDRGGVDPEEIVAALAEAFKKEYGSNPGRYPMQAILFEAEKP